MKLNNKNHIQEVCSKSMRKNCLEHDSCKGCVYNCRLFEGDKSTMIITHASNQAQQVVELNCLPMQWARRCWVGGMLYLSGPGLKQGW